jgi:hypothetical protein
MSWIITKEVSCSNCAYSKSRRGTDYRGHCDKNIDSACLTYGLKLDKMIVSGVKFVNHGRHRYSQFEPYFQNKDMFSDEDFEL